MKPACNALLALCLKVVSDNDPFHLFSILQSPEEDEEEDFRVLPTDNLLAIGKAEEDYSSVEVHGKNNSHHCVAQAT